MFLFFLFGQKFSKFVVIFLCDPFFGDSNANNGWEYQLTWSAGMLEVMFFLILNDKVCLKSNKQGM